MKARNFFLLAVALFGLSIFALRNNNITAYNQRAIIIERDAAGQSITKELEQLQDYVFTHMNTSMNVVLEGRYQRAVTKAKQAADKAFDPTIYAKAQAACDREGVLTTENARCVQEYLERRLDKVPEAKLPEREQYSYVFIAPTWTNDLAGISLLAGIIAALWGMILYIRAHWRSLLKIRA